MPHDLARERYAKADIVVDQLNAGWHGVFALEAMALGKPVVGYLDQEAVARSAAAFGLRLPIIPATKTTLAESLRPLVESPALRREIGAESRHYVEQVHDIERIADRLLEIYAEISPAAQPTQEGELAQAEASQPPANPPRPRARGPKQTPPEGELQPARLGLAAELTLFLRRNSFAVLKWQGKTGS